MNSGARRTNWYAVSAPRAASNLSLSTRAFRNVSSVKVLLGVHIVLGISSRLKKDTRHSRRTAVGSFRAESDILRVTATERYAISCIGLHVQKILPLRISVIYLEMGTPVNDTYACDCRTA